jgi:hypothetical protein
MIYIIVAQAVILCILLLLHQREVAHWREIVWNMSVREATERASLLDRIQHPEIRQVESSEPIVHEQPKDLAEMAWVGQEVPEFVKVGDES